MELIEYLYPTTWTGATVFLLGSLLTVYLHLKVYKLEE
ncbi:hypothetical protein J2Z26_004113 [Bacillus luteolus]|nr:hypothetical protein [Cytobacillus luteolus]